MMAPGSAAHPRVLLADDHAAVCEGFRALLEPACNVVGTVHQGDRVVEAVVRLRPDVVLLDISMPGRNGLEVARELRRDHPETRVILLTMHAEQRYADEAKAIGVAGFALKLSNGAELRRAVTEVMAGRWYMTPDLRNPVPGSTDAASRTLTTRQLQVLRLVAEGRTAAEIARELGIRSKTVEFHRMEIKKALKVKTTAAMIRYAVAQGVVPADVVR